MWEYKSVDLMYKVWTATNSVRAYGILVFCLYILQQTYTEKPFSQIPTDSCLLDWVG